MTSDTKPKIYAQHDAAFSNVSAFVITNKAGKRVATIAFKFPRDGAGRLYAYVHWLGAPMVRGYAGGYGYDKKSAAVENAVDKINTKLSKEFTLFWQALKDIDGETWDTCLHDAGFNVLQAV